MTQTLEICSSILCIHCSKYCIIQRIVLLPKSPLLYSMHSEPTRSRLKSKSHMIQSRNSAKCDNFFIRSSLNFLKKNTGLLN